MRPGYQTEYKKNKERYVGRNIIFYDTIVEAYAHVKNQQNQQVSGDEQGVAENVPIIFIHQGVHSFSNLIIDCYQTGV